MIPKHQKECPKCQAVGLYGKSLVFTNLMFCQVCNSRFCYDCGATEPFKVCACGAVFTHIPSSMSQRVLGYNYNRQNSVPQPNPPKKKNIPPLWRGEDDSLIP